MNRHGFIGKILPAIFVTAVFVTQANPLLSFAPAEEPVLSSAGQSPAAEEGLTLTGAAEIALRHNPLLQATSSAGQMAAAQLSEARAGRWPLLQFSETFTNGNNPVFVFGSLLEQRRFGPQKFIELRLKQGMDLADAVVDAGAVRFRPMMLTAAAVIVGSSVILFDPIFQGLAISLMAGEVASLFLSRMTVPILYYLSGRRKYSVTHPLSHSGKK